MKHGLREKSLLKQGVTGASIQKLRNSETLGQKVSQVFPRPTHLLGFHTLPCLLLESPGQRTDVPAENYDDAEEVPVPGTPPASQGSEEEVLPEKDVGVRSSQTGEWGQLISCNLSIWKE